MISAASAHMSCCLLKVGILHILLRQELRLFKVSVRCFLAAIVHGPARSRSRQHVL